MTQIQDNITIKGSQSEHSICVNVVLKADILNMYFIYIKSLINNTNIHYRSISPFASFDTIICLEKV